MWQGEQWASVMSVVDAQGCNLRSLEMRVSHHYADQERTVAVSSLLANALRNNIQLDQLCVVFQGEFLLTETEWKSLFDAIAGHRKLPVLDLQHNSLSYEIAHSQEFKIRRTQQVVDMLAVNRQLEEMKFPLDDPHRMYELYDRGEWDLRVAPRLEENLYRNRFQAMRGDKQYCRAALVGAALGHVVSSMPRPFIHMLLVQEKDIVLSHLTEAEAQAQDPVVQDEE
jgi:hypothetical protein